MGINWQELFSKDLDWSFAGEILIRTLIMFILTLAFLRMSGKKGVRQLSIFEVAIIIALGSAAGDPMLNKDSPVLPSIIAFAVILGLYRLLTFLASRFEPFERVLEGDPVYIIEDGMFALDHGENTYGKDEFFAEMRASGIEHLGQVKTALLETNGTVSFFFYPDEDVISGLPVLPKVYERKSKAIPRPDTYACTYCGQVEQLEATSVCGRCKHEEWVAAINTTRIT